MCRAKRTGPVRNPTPGPPHPAARQLGIPDPKPGTAVQGLRTGRCPGNSIVAIPKKITDGRVFKRKVSDKPVKVSHDGSDHDPGTAIRLPEMVYLRKPLDTTDVSDSICPVTKD